MINHLTNLASRDNLSFPSFKKRVHCPVTNITYQLDEQIGSGSAAVVFRAHRLFLHNESQNEMTVVDTRKEYAVKVFNLRRMRLHSNYEREQEKLKREMTILKSLHHPCIVNLLHVIETKNKLYFIMELIKGGELFDKIIDKGAFNETEARYIIIQILYALHYLHEKNIIHRDLKPENILIADEYLPNFYNVKIADFGLAKCFRDGFDEATTFVGTPQYWAPEVIDSASGLRNYGTQADLWSLGCVIYVMLAGAYPFDTRLAPIDKLIKQASFHFNHPRFQSISSNAKHLIHGLLTVDPDKRLTIKQVFQHPWIEAFHIFKSIHPSIIESQPNISQSFHPEKMSSTPYLPCCHQRSSFVPLDHLKTPIEDIFKDRNSTCSIDRTTTTQFKFSTPERVLDSSSNLPIPSINMSNPNDLSNLKLHTIQNDLFSKPFLNVTSEPHNIVLAPPSNFSSFLSSNQIFLPAHSPPSLYDITHHDLNKEFYSLTEAKTTPDINLHEIKNTEEYHSTLDLRHTGKIVHQRQNSQVVHTQPHSNRSFETHNLRSNFFLTCPNFIKTSNGHSHCSLPITFYHTTRMIFSMFGGQHNVSSHSTEMMFNLKKLLCLQMTITQKIKCLYILLRFFPKILRPLKKCILKKYKIQHDSIHIIKQFESICLSVLSLFPDLFWAVSTNQLDLGLQLLNDMLLWISSLKREILRHQQCVEDFLRQISALLTLIEAVQMVSRQNLMSALHSINACLTNSQCPKQLFTENSSMAFNAHASSGFTQSVINHSLSNKKCCNVANISSLPVIPEKFKIHNKNLSLSVPPTVETLHDKDQVFSLNLCEQFLLPVNLKVQCALQKDISIELLNTYRDQKKPTLFQELVLLVESKLKCIIKETYNSLYDESWHSSILSQPHIHQENPSCNHSFNRTHMLNSQFNKTPLLVLRDSDTLCIVQELFNFILMASRFYSVPPLYHTSTRDPICHSFLKTLPCVPSDMPPTNICYADPSKFLYQSSNVSSNSNFLLNQAQKVNKNFTNSFFWNQTHHPQVYTGETLKYSSHEDLPLSTPYVNDNLTNGLFPYSNAVGKPSQPLSNPTTPSSLFDAKESFTFHKNNTNSSLLKDILQTSSEYLNRTKTSLIFLNQKKLSSTAQNKYIQEVNCFDRFQHNEIPSFLKTSAYHDALWTTHVLAFAIQEVKQVKQILQQCLSFWMNFILIIERLSLIRNHTTRLLQNTNMSPYITKRLQNTLVHYKLFWNSIKDQLCYYSQNAQGKIDTMEEFVIHLNKIAENVDMLLPLD